MNRTPGKNQDLHGNVPESSPVALLLVDVINDMEFEGAEALVRQAVPMARRIAALKERARAAKIPAVYINDNFGRWQSDFRKLVDHVLDDGVPGEEVARILEPAEDDYFVLKPKHSGFFSTTLDILLDYLQARTLILTGLTGDICVLFTAHDAYMRDFNLVIPADCVASNDPRENEYALKKMEGLMDADIGPSTELDFEKLKAASRREPEPRPAPEPKQAAR